MKERREGMGELLETVEELRGELSGLRDELAELREQLEQEVSEREGLSSEIDDLRGCIDDVNYAVRNKPSSGMGVRKRGRPREFGDELAAQIKAGRAAGESVRGLAARLGVSPSTVQRLS